MSQDLTIEARNKAGEYFKQGYNCAEAIFLTYREILAPEVDQNLMRMVTGFGGGLGHAGCMCGALAVSNMMLGLIKGRTNNNEEERLNCYALAKNFHDKFEEKFGNTCCRVLNPHPFDTPEHLKNCLKITGNTAKLLYEYLNEKELLK